MMGKNMKCKYEFKRMSIMAKMARLAVTGCPRKFEPQVHWYLKLEITDCRS